FRPSEDAVRVSNITQDDIAKISSILAAAGTRLQYIYPHELTDRSHLGAGSCFRVECKIFKKKDPDQTPQLVAVKYLRLPKSPARDTNKFYDGVMRELRVLTHPPFRNHACIIEALAYGWSASSLTGIHPYLVMDYSVYGTLAVYLHKFTPPVEECREFALDIAVGLQALHHSGIVHGDLKLDNVLVFDADGDRPQVAKLADFGASIFDVDFDDGPVSYGGTARYNAPEQEGRLGPQAWRVAQTREAFYKADIYSLGLCVWEAIIRGDDFCDPEWLLSGETVLDFLDRICETETDGLLGKARFLCEERFADIQESTIKNAIAKTFDVTLRDDAAARADIDTVVTILADGTSQVRPLPFYPRLGTGPGIYSSSPPKNGLLLQLYRTRADIASDIGTSASNNNESERLVKAREKPRDEPVPTREPAPEFRVFGRPNLDIFQILSSGASPPWTAQQSIADKLKIQANEMVESPECADSHLQLSLCFESGFGVEPDVAKVLHHLRKASSHSLTARSIRRRLEIACDDQNLMKLDFTTTVDHQIEHLTSSPLYFSERVRLHQKTLVANERHHQLSCNRTDTSGVLTRRENLLDLASEAGDTNLIRRLLSERNWAGKELVSALVKSCEYGHFSAAELLASHCSHPAFESNRPSPLHWLIMFSENEAEDLAKLLVLGSGRGVDNANGVLKGMINAMPPAGSEPRTFPEHCLQLVGSPLHWAVGTRNLSLVLLLLRFGADIHQRWSFARRFDDCQPSEQRPSCTPLELAIVLHLPEIIDVLWSATPYTKQAEIVSSAGLFQCIGQVPSPFLRRMIHGAEHVAALRKTIATLRDMGFDITGRDGQVQSVFMAALAEPDQEPYVLDETLEASGYHEDCTADGMNAVTLVAATSLGRQQSAYRMQIASRIVIDINRANSLEMGMNALHYVAAANSARLCEVLLQRSDVDINKRNSKGATAMHLAAMLNAAPILKLLLRNRAEVEMLDNYDQSALALSVFFRDKIAAGILMEAGASTITGNEGDSSRTSILHLAVSSASSSDSMASYLLDTYPDLSDATHLNFVDRRGWTPLHRAAYFGDYAGTAALMRHGADTEIQCTRPFPIAEGRTALDVVTNLLETLRVKRVLGIFHTRITREGAQGIATFRSCLEEVRVLLSQKSLS
ncbi:MAG: hypothetical protein Q9193_004183, partial [Seirophora villosa]